MEQQHGEASFVFSTFITAVFLLGRQCLLRKDPHFLHVSITSEVNHKDDCSGFGCDSQTVAIPVIIGLLDGLLSMMAKDYFCVQWQDASA